MLQEIFRGIDAAASLKRALYQFAGDMNCHIFRGIDAAASLKRLLSCRCCDHGKCYLPRHRCRGLIEARWRSFRIQRWSLIFRGIDAAASLKRR